MLRVLKLTEVILCVFLVVAIIGLTSIQIVARYGMNEPFTWTEELSRFALISLTFLGAALVTGSSGHIVVDLSGPAKGLWSRRIDGLARSLVVLSAIFLMVIGISKALSVGDLQASATGFPLAALYWIMAISFALMALHAFLPFFVKSEETPEGIRGI